MSTFFYFAYGTYTDFNVLKKEVQALNLTSLNLDEITPNSNVGYVSGLRLSFTAVSRDSPRVGLVNLTPEAPHRSDVDLTKYRHAAPQLLSFDTPAPISGRVYGVVHELPLELKPALLEAVGREGSYNLVSEQECVLVTEGESRCVTAVVVAGFDMEVVERQFELPPEVRKGWAPLPPLQLQDEQLEEEFASTVQWGTGRWPGTHWCNFPSSFHLAPTPEYLESLRSIFDNEILHRCKALPKEYLSAYEALWGSSSAAATLTRDPQSSPAEAKTWYLAYGSNLSWEQVCVRIGPAYQRRAVKLDGYMLVPNKMPYSSEYASFGYYNVEPVAVRQEKERKAEEAGESITPNVMPPYVVGAAYEMSQSQLELMDKFEGGYTRENHRCVTLDGKEELHCWVYIAEDTKDTLLPSKEYLSRVLEGKDLLPEDYRKGIEGTQTNPQRSPRQERRLRKEL